MKNELLEQVRNQIAKEKGFSSWQQFAWRLGTYSEEHDEVSFRYAKEFAKAELEKLKEGIEKKSSEPTTIWEDGFEHSRRLAI